MEPINISLRAPLDIPAMCAGCETYFAVPLGTLAAVCPHCHQVYTIAWLTD
jgi:hypothetical protein